jgi:hypothetical protein
MSVQGRLAQGHNLHVALDQLHANVVRNNMAPYLLLQRLAELITTETAERRSLVLVNPALAPRRAAASTLSCPLSGERPTLDHAPALPLAQCDPRGLHRP